MHLLPSAFKGLNIVVVGDIMLDRYLWGKVRRISPEAPVPIVKLENVTETLGGAGNVATNLASLGCAVSVIGICGTDPTAAALRTLLDQKGIRAELVQDNGRPTITKSRIMAQKQQILRLDEENTDPVDKATGENILAAVRQALGAARALIISDYGKGLFSSPSLTQEIIRAGRERDIPVLVDPKGIQWERYQGATCITPNTAELEAVTGSFLEKDQDLLVAHARQVRSRYDLQWLLVTRGAQGMCLVGRDDETLLISARAREVFDVSGAGDTVIATLAAALAAGGSFADAARAANVAAGIVVGKLGTQPVLASELETALLYADTRNRFPYSTAKKMALDAALAKVRDWKSVGARIVFTNGCFDLLHPGHISLLHQARAHGDRLIVGLNTDASIRRLKGPERPILAEQDRAAILCALECVDLVVSFDEDTPLNLIRSIRPDILVKGSDYTLDQVVGRDVVEAYGGSVKLVDLVQGYSTTRITRKVLAGANHCDPAP